MVFIIMNSYKSDSDNLLNALMTAEHFDLSAVDLLNGPWHTHIFKKGMCQAGCDGAWANVI